MPACRRGRAMSRARGNWFDCTPTSPTSPKKPFFRKSLTILSGRMRVLHSSTAVMVISTSGPSACRSAALAARLYTTASEFDGIAERSHYYIAFVVVMRRLDQHDLEAPPRRCPGQHLEPPFYYWSDYHNQLLRRTPLAWQFQERRVV